MTADRLLSILPFMVLLLPLAGFTTLALLGDRIRRDREDTGAGVLACGTVFLSFVAAVVCAVHFAGLRAEHGAALKAHQARLAGLGLSPEAMEDALGELQQPLYLTPQLTVPTGLGRTSLGLPVLTSDGREAVDWIRVGEFRVPVALLIDPLSLVMMLVVTGVGFLIHVYSLGYMAHDEERVRYFSYLNLFTFFMLLLVMGGSLPLMFVGWEGVGLCSYLLIGFWYRKKSASDAGKKAFIVNRIGDAGLILGMILSVHALGTVDLAQMAEMAGAMAREPWAQFGAVTGICLLLFVGACGKSAQVPLHVWLPDAMEGPTPVSALIHAATMVTAGVYMVARLAPLYLKSETAMTVVAVVGTVTALMAATVAIVQTDIKRVLAYSTVSQLGFMFLAAGVGAFGAAVFHLFTHAFFKALLFLGSGSVIHALSGEQDLRRMGGLWKLIPVTFYTFAVGTLAIAGIPFLSGFFSKDMILAGALDAHRPVLFGVAFATAMLTAFYMARLLALAFLGQYRGGATPAGDSAHGGHDAGDAGHGPGQGTGHGVHESPWVMLVPLIVLAVGSAAAGYVALPEFVQPVFRAGHAEAHHAAWLPWAAGGAAIVAFALGILLYTRYGAVREGLARALRPLAGLAERKYGFDLAFDWFARRAVVQGSEQVLWQGVDAGVIDRAVVGTAAAVDGASRGVRHWQSGLVRGYALLILGGAVLLLGYLLWM
ncbi:MAG TPA: NADH-quinone oxidoreductase subunit L [Vicinamibacteria bacterium]|nr:NADH-quinone oxidoreductase subunit L [Vicinamibacteria bacterium]